MAFRQIKSPALANQAVINTKLDVTAVSGQTSVASIAGTDELLLNASAGLRKITASSFVASFSTDDLAEGANLYFTDARAQAAVAADIATAVQAEEDRAVAEEARIEGKVDAEIARATAAEGVLTADLAAEVTRATGREDAIEAAYQAADTNLQTQINNILNNADPAALDSLAEIVTAFQNADDSLTAAINTNAANIASEITRAQGAEATLQSNINTVQAELDATQTGAGLGADGSYTADGAANYISGATSLSNADVLLDSAIKAMDTAYKAADTSINNDITALEGRMDTAESDIDTLESDLAAEVARAEAAEQANANAIQAEVTARGVAVQGAKDYADANDAVIQAELDATQAGAGLNTDGSFTADGTNSAAATTLKAAIKAVDDALVTEQANVDTLESEMDAAEGRLDTAEADIDALEAVVGDLGSTPLDTTAQTLAGAINEVHGEVDAIETRVTQNEADIAANLASINNIISNTDPDALDSLTEIVAAFQAADSSLTGLISANQTAISNEVTRATGAEATLQSNIDSEATTRANADTTLQGNIDSEEAARIAADSAIQSELDATQAGAGLGADGGYTANGSANYIAAATSLKDADNKLDAAIKVVADDLATEISTTNGEISALTTRVGDNETAIASNATAISTENARATGAEATLQSNIDDVQAELDTTQTGAGLNADGTYTANGSANYISTATSLKDADTKLDAQAKVNADAIATETQARIDAVAAEAALRVSGDNALQANIDNEETARINADNALDGRVTTNEGDIATLQANLTTEIGARETADNALDTRLTTAEGDIDALEASVANIISNTDPAALDSLTEIVSAFQAADGDLDQAITDLATAASTARDTLRTDFEAADTALDGRLTTAEGEIDSLQTFTGEGTALTTTATTLAGAINELNSGSAAAVAAVQAEVDAIETSLGLAADGTFVAYSGTNHIDAATSFKNADVLLDSAIKAEETARIAAVTTEATTRANEDTAIRGEFAAADTTLQQAIDAVETGAGLGTDGSYTANGSANYISAATSLKDADNKLDAALKAADTAYKAADVTLQTNIDAEATTRASADTTLQNNIDAEATTRANADSALDTRLTAAETEITATQTGAGLGTDGTYTANGSANYISTAVSLKDADNKLDAAIKAENTRALGEESRIETKLDDEIARATAAEAANATAIQTVSDNLAQELLDRAAADTALQDQIDSILSNTDPAALDSLTEIVAAFQSADGDLGTLVANNATAISDEETARIAADTTLQNNINAEASARATADTTLQTNIDGKVAKSGDTMSGVLDMGGNTVTGLPQGSADSDAVNVAQLNAAISAQDISVYTTDDLTEGTNLYYTDARARAAISVVDTEGNGDISYNSTTGVLTADLSKSLLELTDVTETTYAGAGAQVLVVNASEDGVEFVPASELQIFGQSYRQVIDGDGTTTTFALNFLADEASTLVFVGGVIQDPVSHYTLDTNNQEVTFNTAMPVGTQAVIIARELVGAQPFIQDGSIAQDKLASNLKVFTQSGNVAAGTGGAVVDSFDSNTYRSAKYTIQVDNGAGEYETREALVLHDGTNAYITEYAIVYTGAGLLGDASVQMNGTAVELVYTANAAGTSVKVISTYIDL